MEIRKPGMFYIRTQEELHKQSLWGRSGLSEIRTWFWELKVLLDPEFSRCLISSSFLISCSVLLWVSLLCLYFLSQIRVFLPLLPPAGPLWFQCVNMFQGEALPSLVNYHCPFGTELIHQLDLWPAQKLSQWQILTPGLSDVGGSLGSWGRAHCHPWDGTSFFLLVMSFPGGLWGAMVILRSDLPEHSLLV